MKSTGANAHQENLMNKLNKPLLALALALSVGSVYAQSSTGGDAGAQGGGITASSGSFQSWLNTYGAKNSGRISRKAYMDEASRRWDSMDKTKQGLTMDEINRTYYHSGPAAVMGGPTATNSQEKKGITN